MTLRALVAAAALLLAPAACVSASAAASAEPAGLHGDSRSITPADLTNATQVSLYEFVAAERPQWIRGPDGRPVAVSVYVNDALVGGSAALRDITLSQVAGARYFDLAAAQQRYSTRLAGPVIAVTLR